MSREYIEISPEVLGKEESLAERVRLKKAKRASLYTLEPPFPKSNFLIELSNACNHDCIFCAHQKMQRKIGKIDKEFAFDILHQAYNLGTREVGFYATGEPFIVNDLADYIAKAKDIGYTYIYLTSNGALATPEKIREVINAGLDSIKFSINAPTRKLYEFIHGHDDFDAVVEHLKYLGKYREETGKDYKIYTTMIVTRFTEELQDYYHEVFDPLCDQVVFKYVYNQGGYMPEIETYLRCRCDKEERRRCNLPFDAICVTHEGYLSIENADYENMLIVADLNEVSLHDGWYGDKMKEMRQKFIDDTLDGTICDGCVHHTLAPGKAITPQYSSSFGDREYDFSDSVVKKRMDKCDFKVYVINIIKIAAQYGKVIVGLFTDEAIASYKRVPYMPYEHRKTVIENIKGVYEVIPQKTRDYDENIRMLKPDFMVHGKDWREGPLADVREKAINTMREWQGQIVEPDYTHGVSSTMIQKKIVERAKGKSRFEG